MSKKCSRCGELKQLSEFHRNRTMRDGLQSSCKSCRNALNAAWRTKNPELHREINAAWDSLNMDRKRAGVKAWRMANADRERKSDAERRRRRRALKRGATVGTIDLDGAWASGRGRCGLCGQQIDPNVEWPDPQSKSIDHILPLSKGGSHTQGNVQWAHLVCNVRKGNRLAPNFRPGGGTQEPPGGVKL